MMPFNNKPRHFKLLLPALIALSLPNPASASEPAPVLPGSQKTEPTVAGTAATDNPNSARAVSSKEVEREIEALKATSALVDEIRRDTIELDAQSETKLTATEKARRAAKSAALNQKIDELNKQLDKEIGQLSRADEVAFVPGHDAGEFQPYVNTWQQRILATAKQAEKPKISDNKVRRALVSVQISPSGELLDVEINKSSGSPLLDQWLMKQIAASAPFAPYSAQYPKIKRFLSITQSFNYRPSAPAKHR